MNEGLLVALVQSGSDTEGEKKKQNFVYLPGMKNRCQSVTAVVKLKVRHETLALKLKMSHNNESALIDFNEEKSALILDLIQCLAFYTNKSELHLC